MKIIAQSIIPVTPLPYLHLGYIAAAPFSEASPYLIMMFIFIYLRSELQKKSRVWGRIFMGLAVASGIAALLAFRHGTITFKYTMTKLNANHFLDQATRMVTNNDTSIDLEKLYTDTGRKLHDGWDRPYRFKTNMEGNVTSYSLTSAGRDGLFGTKDDTVYEKSVTIPPPGEKPRQYE